jgi:prevent-host-death family protein
MKKATIRDLRYRMKEVLRTVERGETVTVLYRGKEKAKIVPIEQTKRKSVADHPAFGMWKDREDMKDVDAWVRNIRKGRKLDL